MFIKNSGLKQKSLIVGNATIVFPIGISDQPDDKRIADYINCDSNLELCDAPEKQEEKEEPVKKKKKKKSNSQSQQEESIEDTQDKEKSNEEE